MRRSSDTFLTVKTEGAILPADLLRRIIDGDCDVPGLSPEDYHLAKSERLNEAATRAWNRLQGAWEGFKDAMEAIPETDAGTSLTRERWLLILFQELGYGRLTTRKAYEIGGKGYPISHEWQNTPIHLVSFRQSIDKRTPKRAGAARVSPHSLVQELLNRSEDHLWGFVSNGLALRLLRDNVSLTRQAYIEFDLQSMMDSEAYSDFFLLFLLCHQSRVEVPEGKTVEHCRLEKWYGTATQQGVRALDQLRDGVQNAIEVLGGGFLAHPANAQLHEKLRMGRFTVQDYYRQVLRQVYRLLFLFVAEDRALLFDPNASAEAKKLYKEHYSTQRLRDIASRTRGTRHPDLWRALRLVFDSLQNGCPQLGLPALASFLFSAEATADLNEADIANSELLKAVRSLAFTVDRNVLRSVNYRNLGPEELGSVYESLLEMQPVIHMEATNPNDRFRLTAAAGSERKTTGSYYTPASLVNCLLDSALDPVIDEAAKRPDPEKALLGLKICDPACGSGHFLIAAAHRLAKRLAAVRAGEDEPAPETTCHALRDVISHCVYGVDINPMSVELCKVSLWMEAMEPGRPLAFLEHHIKCGNSLLGATPALLKKGIPDEAFEPIEGDDGDYCKKLKKQNKSERRALESGQKSLFYPWERLGDLATAMINLDEMPDSTAEEIHKKQIRYEDLIKSSGYLFGHLWADAWCAAFVWEKTRDNESVPYAITEQDFRAIEKNPHGVPPWMRDEIQRLAGEYRFFHWHLEFPDVFRVPKSDEEPGNEQTGWSGGFDCVLGNPPWERIKLQEKEFFASRDPEIADAPNAAARRRLIAQLSQANPALYREFQDALRRADGESRLIRDTSRYPLCGRGDVNTYSIFAELKRSLLNPAGRVGCIVPSGIATDDTTKFFFQNLTEKASLVSLYDFENRQKIFPAIDSRMKFCLLTMAAPSLVGKRSADFVFFAYDVADLADKERHFTLTDEEIALLNPNTRTCPIFRSRRDAELTKYIYRRVPVLIREARDGQPEQNPWGIKFSTMFHMSNDSHLFRTREQLENEGFTLEGNVFHRDGEQYLPLYEAKLFHQYDHRFATYAADIRAQQSGAGTRDVTPSEKSDPSTFVLPRYWVPAREVEEKLYNDELISRERERERERTNTLSCYASSREPQTSERQSAQCCHNTESTTKPRSFDSWVGGSLEVDYKRDQSTHRDRGSDPSHRGRKQGCRRVTCRWLLPIRKTTNATNERTTITSFTPRAGMSDRAPLLRIHRAELAALLVSGLNSVVLDFAARTAVGGTDLSYFIIKQLPVLPPIAFEGEVFTGPADIGFIMPCAVELTYTAWDMESFALDCGYDGPPFKWDEERRFLIRCELDAAFFHLYLGNEQEWKEKGSKELTAYLPTPRHAIEYIMETFPIVKRQDEQKYGTYRTKDTILEIYDEMARVMAKNAEAVAAGREPTAPYQTRLNPPPGPPCDEKGNFISMAQWDSANWPSHIHRPREAPAVRPEEVPLSAFASMAYPSTDADKAVCAAALAVIEQSGGLSSMEHLDALLLATHPDWCKAFLNQVDQRALAAAMRSAPGALFVGRDQSIRWKECRDYLECLGALTVARNSHDQPIWSGTAMSSAKASLRQDVDSVVVYALKSLNRVRELRKDMSSVPQEQRTILDAFAEQHRLYALAA